MMPQMSALQVEAALKGISARINAKKLEIDSLNTLRNVVPTFLDGLFAEALTKIEEPPSGDIPGVVMNAVTNYMTAKINQGLMDLEQLMLQKTMFESQQRQVQLATGVLPNNRRPQG